MTPIEFTSTGILKDVTVWDVLAQIETLIHQLVQADDLPSKPSTVR